MAALAFTFFSFFKTFLPHAEMRGRGYSGIILKGERRGGKNGEKARYNEGGKKKKKRKKKGERKREREKQLYPGSFPQMRDY